MDEDSITSEEDTSDNEEDWEDNFDHPDDTEETVDDTTGSPPEDSVDLTPGTYVVAVYQGAWYISQVLDKDKEKKALQTEAYVFISFMERVGKNSHVFRWPDRSDNLNTLKEDVLFACRVPTPSTTTSSGRGISYTLSDIDLKKAEAMSRKHKAY